MLAREAAGRFPSRITGRPVGIVQAARFWQGKLACAHRNGICGIDHGPEFARRATCN